jgi:hypothetical protein
VNASDIFDSPHKIPVEMLVVELRKLSPSMDRAYKIHRLKVAALMVALAEKREAKGLSAGDLFSVGERILSEVGEKLAPGWFARQVELAKAPDYLL